MKMKDWSEEWNKRRSEAGWKGQRKTKASPVSLVIMKYHINHC